MRTALLYLEDNYLRDFTATVIAVDEEQRRLALDRTAFYPGGGGQPADTGILLIEEHSLPVTRVKREGELVWHWVEGPLPRVGTTLTGRIDWERRYLLMRTHTALHILSAVVYRDYGAKVTGGNMEPGRGRMDFEFAHLTRDLVQEIEAKVNAEVDAARPVTVRILPREEAFQIPDLIRTKINLLPPHITEVRVVEIVGLDLQADGGTHVANTREVGKVIIPDYKSKGKINKRIYLALA